MEFELFGFTIKKTKDYLKKKEAESFVLPDNKDGAVTVEGVAGAYGAYIDFDATIKNEFELVTRYRELSLLPDVDAAIDDIINEMIVQENSEPPVELDLSSLNKPKELKKTIEDEFVNILKLLDWKNQAYEIAKKWYIDGRLYYHVILDNDSPQKGILELRYIDPRQIRKIREIQKEIDNETGAELVKLIDEYFVYNQRGITYNTTTAYSSVGMMDGAKISTDAICYTHSGIVDKYSASVLSHLHKAIKPINQLKMMEDAMVIYRIARAPERRIFYVDVGNLPKSKADDYLRTVMQRYRNKMVYNIETGEVRDDRRFLSMLEDFWLPRREGCIKLDTQIPLLDGRELPLSEIINEFNQGKTLWAYSCSSDGNIVPGKISWAGVTRKNAQVVKITLDNGKEITSTLDHKFIRRNGEKVEAKNLKVGDSLMPFYSRLKNISKNYGGQYHQIFDNNASEWKFTYRMVSEYMERPSKYGNKYGYRNQFIPTSTYNHKVVNIEFLNEKFDVGTLTIDKNHEYHDYHNFAVSAGVFIMNSQGTSIETLPGGENLGEMADVEYFQKKVYRALNVPTSRLDPENGVQLARTSEITRDEIKFAKFIYRIRARFSYLFHELLSKQLILKNIIRPEEWDGIKNELRFKYQNDNYFAELKESEILKNRLELISQIDSYTQKYFSVAWIRKNVLRQSIEEQKKMDSEIKSEKNQYEEPNQPKEKEATKITNFDDGLNFNKPKKENEKDK